MLSLLGTVVDAATLPTRRMRKKKKTACRLFVRPAMITHPGCSHHTWKPLPGRHSCSGVMQDAWRIAFEVRSDQSVRQSLPAALRAIRLGVRSQWSDQTLESRFCSRSRGMSDTPNAGTSVRSSADATPLHQPITQRRTVCSPASAHPPPSQRPTLTLPPSLRSLAKHTNVD